MVEIDRGGSRFTRHAKYIGEIARLYFKEAFDQILCPYIPFSESFAIPSWLDSVLTIG